MLNVDEEESSGLRFTRRASSFDEDLECMAEPYHVIFPESLPDQADRVEGGARQKACRYDQECPRRPFEYELRVTESETDEAGESESEGAEEVPGPHVGMRPEPAAKEAAVSRTFCRYGEPW